MIGMHSLAWCVDIRGILEAEAFRSAHCEDTMLCGSADRAKGKGADALGATNVPF